MVSSSRAPLRWIRRAVISMCFAALAPALFAQSQSAKYQPVKFITFRVGLRSVAPSSITVSAGRYYVRILNTLIVEAEVPFTLAREEGGKAVANVIDSKVKKNQSAAAKTIDLTPGVYTLSVGGRQEWQSRITVKASE